MSTEKKGPMPGMLCSSLALVSFLADFFYHAVALGYFLPQKLEKFDLIGEQSVIFPR